MSTQKLTRCLRAICAFLLIASTLSARGGEPLRLAVAGVSHGHLWEVIRRLDRGDFEVVGVAERDNYLRAHNGLREKLPADRFYADLGEMLDKTRPRRCAWPRAAARSRP